MRRDMNENTFIGCGPITALCNGAHKRDEITEKLLNSNNKSRNIVVRDCLRGYNNDEKTRTNASVTTETPCGEHEADIERLTRYAGWKDELRRIRKLIVEGRIVKNNAQVRIGVAGKLKSKDGDIGSVFLWPGEYSTKYLFDADAVVILPGQKYYRSRENMTKDNIVGSGAIKVKDIGTTVEVACDWKTGVFYVNSSWTTYYNQSEADGKGWCIPR